MNMPNPENIKGKGFDKNPQNINKKGREPIKLISSVIKELEKIGIKSTNKTEIREVYLMLLNLSIKDLHKISDDKTQPALVYIVAKQIISGRGYEIIEKMLDRAIGKAEQQIDCKGIDKYSHIPPVNIAIDGKDIVLK